MIEEQRRLALQRANRVRTARARLKRDMKAGRVNLRDLLDDPPEYLETMKIGELLQCTPNIGRVTTGKVLVGSRVSPTLPLQKLGPPSRQRILREIESRSPTSLC